MIYKNKILINLIQIFLIFSFQNIYSIHRFDPRLISEQELFQLIDEFKQEDDLILKNENN